MSQFFEEIPSVKFEILLPTLVNVFRSHAHPHLAAPELRHGGATFEYICTNIAGVAPATKDYAKIWRV